MLQQFGITVGAASLYQKLLARPGASAFELAEQLGMEEHEASAASGELTEFGLAFLDPASGALRAANPELAIAARLRHLEADHARRDQELAEARAAAATAAAAWSAVAADEGGKTSVASRWLSGTLQGIAAACQAIAQARADCLLAVPGSLVAAIARSRIIASALDRGVRIRMMCPDSVRRDNGHVAAMRKITGKGVEVRTVPVLAVPAATIDQRTAVVWPAQERLIGPSGTVVLIQDPPAVAALIAMLDQGWQAAVPLSTRSPAKSATGLAPDDITLIRLLASGLTYEAAGRRLGVSVRTVDRRMARITAALSASSPFQAGYRAASNGWA